MEHRSSSVSISGSLKFIREDDDGNSSGESTTGVSGPVKDKIEGKNYQEYLRLEQLLSNVSPMSLHYGEMVHDEHLFIIIHQTYELWFRQIIFELDSVRDILNVVVVGERNMLTILQRLSRIALIWKTCVEQMSVLETMTALDFLQFRTYLAPGSGFQSLQFRIIENKLGQRMDMRVNQQTLNEAFSAPPSRTLLDQSIAEPSLCDLLDKWLQRTPGLEESGFHFAQRYAKAVEDYLGDERRHMDNEGDVERKKMMEAELRKQQDTFDSLLKPGKHEEKVRQKERRLTCRATMGALMIFCYCDVPRFHLPHQFLTTLMDIDSLITKWRYNHVMLAQRMLGSKTGTGGSSGYHYLRSTISDRYKIFLDLFNISSFIIPRDYIPLLTPDMQTTLHSNLKWKRNSLLPLTASAPDNLFTAKSHF